MGYYRIQEPDDRKEHLRDFSKRIGLSLNNAQGGLAKMVKDLIDDPFKYDKDRL